MRYHTERLQCSTLSATGCVCSSLRHSRNLKKIWHPNPPNRGTKTTARSWHEFSRVEREGQCNSKATPCLSPRELANFGKLRIASVWDGLEFKPRHGGHADKAHYNRGVLYGAEALTSSRLLPRRGYEGLSTLGLKQ